jgi:hypothetical protein
MKGRSRSARRVVLAGELGRDLKDHDQAQEDAEEGQEPGSIIVVGGAKTCLGTNE